MNLEPWQREQIRNAAQGVMDSIMSHNGHQERMPALQRLGQHLNPR